MAAMEMVTGDQRQPGHQAGLRDLTDLPMVLQHLHVRQTGLRDQHDLRHPRDLQTQLLHRTGHPVTGAAAVGVLAAAAALAVAAGEAEA